MIDIHFWENKKVLITGHTGFKGSWLSLWLQSLGAAVYGYSLAPPTNPSLFQLIGLSNVISGSEIADVRDYNAVHQSISRIRPDIVFHLAAQPIVRDSYRIPVETYATNVMGTVHLLEAIRTVGGVKAIVNVTTDKCYENREWVWGYRENEPLGGYDPYSNSKACSELVTASFRNSFFNQNDYTKHGTALASARAGNVIGGGDWATDRLIPDCISALLQGKPVRIRNPHAIRPWQHVLDPLSGYMALAQKLFQQGPAFASGWNFGPDDRDAKPVEWIVRHICRLWGNNASYEIDTGEHPHEANYLKLDCSKAHMELGWSPIWNLATALEKIIEWVDDYKAGRPVRDTCLRQIRNFQEDRDRYES